MDTPNGPRDPWDVPASPVRETPGGIPWEHRDRFGNVAAFWKTVTAVMVSPSRFYRALPADGDYGPAILFSLVVGLIGAVTGAIWNLLAGTMGFLQSDIASGFQNYAYFWVLVAFAPLLILFELFFWSFLTQFLLSLVNAGPAGFKGTLRTIAYAQAPALLSIVPVCGGIVGGVWTIVLQIIGLAQVHRTSTSRAAFATLFPIIVCGGLLAALLALGVFAGLLGTLANHRG